MTPGSGISQAESPELAHARELARGSQNLPGAVLAGAGVAVASAVAWALITVATNYQIGFMAVAVGYAVGLTVRAVGRGFEPVFSFVGAGLAFVGCALGNLLTGCVMLAQYQNVGVMEVLGSLDFATAEKIMVATAQPMDLLFYGLAIWEGFRLSRLPMPAPQTPPAAPP